MSVFSAIVGLLQGDATLVGLLPGGIYDGQTVMEVARQTTPGAFDANSELRPCGIVKAETATPWGPHAHSGRLFVQVFFYERLGYAAVEAARERVYALLHRVQVTPGTGGCYEIRHGGDVLGQEEPGLGAAMAVSRFVATIQR